MQNAINLVELTGNLEADYKNARVNDISTAIDYGIDRSGLLSESQETFEELSETFANIIGTAYFNEFI